MKCFWGKLAGDGHRQALAKGGCAKTLQGPRTKDQDQGRRVGKYKVSQCLYPTIRLSDQAPCRVLYIPLWSMLGYIAGGWGKADQGKADQPARASNLAVRVLAIVSGSDLFFSPLKPLQVAADPSTAKRRGKMWGSGERTDGDGERSSVGPTAPTANHQLRGQGITDITVLGLCHWPRAPICPMSKALYPAAFYCLQFGSLAALSVGLSRIH
jgi:hypothetical protein